ncbi:hypothetical protein FFLO_01463 [Filobasidium floriforme]|uniref:Uncharacterized protein n=1 Tax=Filobasidium floriforme TaxID=5210 RepID=A0A8K0JRH7_9TREE|nr:hypothetical protein FFLO_01463 [Filobasidium floriforme]
MADQINSKADLDQREEQPIVGRKVFIGTLSALAFTTGLTVALIPALKRHRLRTAARQAGTSIRNVGVGRSGTGLGSVQGGNARASGVVQRVSQANPSAIGSRSGAGPLDGLLDPPRPSTSATPSYASSSASGSGSTTVASHRASGASTLQPRSTRTAGPLDGLLGSPEEAGKLGAAGPASAEQSTRRPEGPQRKGAGLLDNLTLGGTAVAAAGAVASPAGSLSSSSTITHTTAPTANPAPTSTLTTTSLPSPSSPADIEPSEPAPQITYFSLTPADPYSDEEDAHGFPLDPEHELNAAQVEAEGEGEEISPWFALKAFSIATALVVGGTAVMVVGIGKGLGVSDMDEFTAKMRSWTQRTLPDLQAQIFKPMESEVTQAQQSDGSLDGGRRRIGFEPAPSSAGPTASVLSTSRKRTKEDEEEEKIVSGWWQGVVEGAEEERRGRRV